MPDSTKPNVTHLGYIQSTITRMGQNAFQAKAWCITIITALLVFIWKRHLMPQNTQLSILHSEWLRCSALLIHIIFTLSAATVSSTESQQNWK